MDGENEVEANRAGSDNHHAGNDHPKTQLYLIDMSTVPDNLQRIIEKEDIATTVIYCFCNSQIPKVPLNLLQKYSEWLQQKKLFIIHPSSAPSSSVATAAVDAQTPHSTSHLLAFWGGKLTAQYSIDSTRIFIASDDSSLYNVVLSLRQDGYEVGSSWPDKDSVQCSDDILCAVLKVIQRNGGSTLPDTLDAFMKFLRTECHLPAYISLESVIRQMQEKGFICLHRGALQYDLPVFLDTLSSTKSRPHVSSKSTARRPTKPRPYYGIDSSE